MDKAVYKLEVDWDNDGTFEGGSEDVSSDFIGGECRTGREYASQLTGKSGPGKLFALLKNTSGTYSSYNTSSAIYGSVKPGRKVKLSITSPATADIWTGYLKRIVPSGPLDGIPTALLEAEGGMMKIAGKEIHPVKQSSQATGALVGAVLDDIGWGATDRTLDTGQSVVGNWFEDRRQALNAIRDIEDTELGFLYEGKDGKIIYEDRHHRLKAPHLTSQATYSDQSGSVLSYSNIEQDDPLSDIYNEIVANVQTYTIAGVSTVLWTYAGANPVIGPGQSLIVWAEYPNTDVDQTTGAYVNSWDTPVVGSDIMQSGVADGDISVSASKFSNSMKITITNNGSGISTVSLIQAQGAKVVKDTAARVSSEDSASQTDYGKRTYKLPSPWLQVFNEAVDYVSYLVSKYKEPMPILTIDYLANRNTSSMYEMYTRAISDRITLVATGDKAKLGINRDFFIEAIAHRIKDYGNSHEVVYELSDASFDSGYWILGTSELGTGTKLAY